MKKNSIYIFILMIQVLNCVYANTYKIKKGVSLEFFPRKKNNYKDKNLLEIKTSISPPIHPNNNWEASRGEGIWVYIDDFLIKVHPNHSVSERSPIINNKIKIHLGKKKVDELEQICKDIQANQSVTKNFRETIQIKLNHQFCYQPPVGDRVQWQRFNNEPCEINGRYYENCSGKRFSYRVDCGRAPWLQSIEQLIEYPITIVCAAANTRSNIKTRNSIRKKKSIMEEISDLQGIRKNKLKLDLGP